MARFARESARIKRAPLSRYMGFESRGVYLHQVETQRNPPSPVIVAAYIRFFGNQKAFLEQDIADYRGRTESQLEQYREYRESDLCRHRRDIKRILHVPPHLTWPRSRV